MTEKEIVKRAVKFDNPPRIPFYLFNKNQENSDIIQAGISSDWGFVMEHLDDTMGQPKKAVIEDWDMLKDYKYPTADNPALYAHLEDFIKKNENKYLIVGTGISGFNLVTFIRGFEDTLIDMYSDMKNLNKLIDIVFEYELGVIKNLQNYKFDAVCFYDDWGTQNALMISPVMWRTIFKPLYKKQFDEIHRQGKHVYFHSCGKMSEIIEDLIEIGVDVFNFNQPEVHGIEYLSRFKGRVAFNCPVDLQKVAIKGSKQEIFDYTFKLIDKLSDKTGGFIGYFEEYHSIGLSDKNYNYCIEALQLYNQRNFK